MDRTDRRCKNKSNLKKIIPKKINYIHNFSKLFFTSISIQNQCEDLINYFNFTLIILGDL